MRGDGAAGGDPVGADTGEPGEAARAPSTASKLPAPARRPVALSSASALTASTVRRGSRPQLDVLRYVVSGANSAAVTRWIVDVSMRPAWLPSNPASITKS